MTKAVFNEIIVTGGMKMVIKILGTGCPKCRKLEENARAALQKTGIPAEIRKVTAIGDIMKYNVVMTPGFVVDEKVKASGKVLSADEIANILRGGK
jgi:small redox-active disulfide protein 2